MGTAAALRVALWFGFLLQAALDLDTLRRTALIILWNIWMMTEKAHSNGFLESCCGERSQIVLSFLTLTTITLIYSRWELHKANSSSGQCLGALHFYFRLTGENDSFTHIAVLQSRKSYHAIHSTIHEHLLACSVAGRAVEERRSDEISNVCLSVVLWEIPTSVFIGFFNQL